MPESVSFVSVCAHDKLQRQLEFNKKLSYRKDTVRLLHNMEIRVFTRKPHSADTATAIFCNYFSVYQWWYVVRTVRNRWSCKKARRSVQTQFNSELSWLCLLMMKCTVPVFENHSVKLYYALSLDLMYHDTCRKVCIFEGGRSVSGGRRPSPASTVGVKTLEREVPLS